MSAKRLLRRVLVALAIPLAAARADAQARIDPELQSALAAGAAGTALNVIVTFHGSRAPGAEEISVLKSVGIQGGGLFRSLPMVATLATAQEVQALSSNPRVRSIYLDRKLQYYNHDATRLTGVDRLQADAAIKSRNRGLPVTGKGVRVVIHDTGIDGTHPDLQYGKHVIENVFGATDRETLEAAGFRTAITLQDLPHTDATGGHGTHVAGTVGGSGEASGGREAGVAPGADLVGYGSGAVLFILNALGGFDWAISNQGRLGIRVITNSWGSSGGFDPDNPINVASRLAHDRNIVVLFAAGNSGSAPDTHNPYAKAPWVISVAAGNKDGTLADFSSRGTPGGRKTVTSVSGEVITWLDEPAVTAPGVDIVSARANTDGASFGGDVYYTSMSGTSMATPHVAGIVALMLEANPLLTPGEVKKILMETATRMPDALPGKAFRSFETGAGYVNAFAAVQKSQNLATPFGRTLQVQGSLANVSSRTLYERTFSYSPASLPGAYKHGFTVEPGTDRLEVDVRFDGVDLPAYGNAGNPLLLDVYDPDGNRYNAFDVLFAVYGTTRLVVVVNNPTPGGWTAEVKSLTPLGNEAGNFLALPDRVHEKITASFFDSREFADVQGHAAQGAIEFALANGFLAPCGKNAFCPDKALRRADLARGFTQFGAIRQFLPVGGGSTFADVSAAEKPFVEAVAAQGAALRDPDFRFGGVMEGFGTQFHPDGKVHRAQFTRMMVRGVGGEDAAQAHAGDVTYLYNGKRYVIADQDQIPANLRGHVHVAINSNMINVFAAVEQGRFDLEPTLKFYFRPTSTVTRADAAVAISRYHAQYFGR